MAGRFLHQGIKYDPKIQLDGPTKPLWGCGKCGVSNNFASRIGCRKCGAWNDRQKVIKAIDAHRKLQGGSGGDNGKSALSKEVQELKKQIREANKKNQAMSKKLSMAGHWPDDEASLAGGSAGAKDANDEGEVHGEKEVAGDPELDKTIKELEEFMAMSERLSQPVGEDIKGKLQEHKQKRDAAKRPPSTNSLYHKHGRIEKKFNASVARHDQLLQDQKDAAAAAAAAAAALQEKIEKCKEEMDKLEAEKCEALRAFKASQAGDMAATGDVESFKTDVATLMGQLGASPVIKGRPGAAEAWDQVNVLLTQLCSGSGPVAAVIPTHPSSDAGGEMDFDDMDEEEIDNFSSLIKEYEANKGKDPKDKKAAMGKIRKLVSGAVKKRVAKPKRG